MAAPHWPEPPRPPAGTPNMLVILFDDVGFSDFGCYGSAIRTPHIDALAQRGLRYSGFHTTAMCSTTRAALLTGRNHHSVGMGCLANFDSGYPGYRGKIAREAGTLAEMLRPHGFRNYMLGKWHVTPLTQSGPTGPFDGWPLGRGFDRYYGFMDAETDQYAPELVRDNTHVDAPGTFASGYHLTADLVDQAIRMIADHTADAAEHALAHLAGARRLPCAAPGAGRADPRVRRRLRARLGRRARAAAGAAEGAGSGAAGHANCRRATTAWPPGTALGADEKQRVHAAAGRLCRHARPCRPAHRPADRLAGSTPASSTTRWCWCCRTTAPARRAGRWAWSTRWGPTTSSPRPMAEKLKRIDDIGGPDTHSNFPHGWAMASNTPLRRYKQNTHGGGIRDPLVISWPQGIAARGELRPQFCHAVDLVPTLLQLLKLEPPAAVQGVAQMPHRRRELRRQPARCRGAAAAQAAVLRDVRPPRPVARGLEGGGLPSAGHALRRRPLGAVPPGPGLHRERTTWRREQPERLKALIDLWWLEAEAHQVLPLDDRFGPRFVESARRYHGPRRHFVFHAGVGHIPSDVAPDVRGRGYRIEAEVFIDRPDAQGVLIAHGDATSGYTLFIRNGKLVHDMNIGGQHHVLESDRPVPQGHCTLGFAVQAGPLVPVPPPPAPMQPWCRPGARARC